MFIQAVLICFLANLYVGKKSRLDLHHCVHHDHQQQSLLYCSLWLSQMHSNYSLYFHCLEYHRPILPRKNNRMYSFSNGSQTSSSDSSLPYSICLAACSCRCMDMGLLDFFCSPWFSLTSRPFLKNILRDGVTAKRKIFNE